MKRQRRIIFILLGVILFSCVVVGLSIALSRQESMDNRKQSAGDADRLVESQDTELGKAEHYVDNEMKFYQTGYYTPVENGGTVETISYQTKNYTGDQEPYEKEAMVYLPYGYQAENMDRSYDILYLMHGSGDDEHWYFGDGSERSDFQCILDHMIANGEIPPCIVCTPTYKNPFCDSEAECVEYFYREFKEDLIPVVEGKYHTYYEDTAKDSRWHRVFGGFSMGAATTWWVFENCMDLVAKYMPISGDSWCGDDGEEKVRLLSEHVEEQGYSPDDFLIFYGSGDVGDLAYQNVLSQVEAMKDGDGIFQYSDNFSTGNFYYSKVKGGGHDIYTVYQVAYNGLQSFFRTPDQDNSYQWAEGIMLDREPKAIDQKDPWYYYGKLKKYQYDSSTAKRKTDVNVLLPPNYSKEETYPVLYLLHGYYDDEDWMADDRVSLRRILGNLIGSGQAKEMIVVMPYIYCSPDRETCTGMDLENSLAYDNFVNDLLIDLKPFIERKFSVARGRENTAITGFSMGGREAIYIGVRHPDLFGYVGAVCPAPGLTPGSDLKQHPGQIPEEELVFPEGQEPYLFLLSAAEDDPAVGKVPYQVHSLLETNGVRHLWNVLPEGGHDASSVRLHLYNYLRMLFRA